LRVGGSDPRPLLDTTVGDTTDGDPSSKAPIRLTRLLRVESCPAGISVLAALRGDNRRGIYRLDETRANDPSRLTRLGLLRDSQVSTELAISAAGQIAFVAEDGSGVVTLFQQAAGRQPAKLLAVGDALSGIDGTITGFSDLAGNAAGDLVV